MVKEAEQLTAHRVIQINHESGRTMKGHALKLFFQLLASPFFLFLFVGQGLAAGNGPGDILDLSLEQARAHALEHSAAMQRARADLQIADRQVWETAAAGLPQVSASLGYNYFIDIPTSLIPTEFFGGEAGDFQEIQFGTQHNLTATASVEQLLFDGQYIVGLRASRIFRELAGQNLVRSRLEIKNTVTESYFLALLARENRFSLLESLENMRRMLEESQQLLQEGFTDPINVDQLRLSVSGMENRLNALERQEELTLRLLKFQLGVDQEQKLHLSDSLERLHERLTQDGWGNDSLDLLQHVDYKIARSQEQMRLMALRREQSAYLPSLSASFVRQEMAMRDSFNFLDGEKPWFPSTYFAVNLNIPIFSSGMRSSRVQQARLELDKAVIDRRELSQALILQLEEASARLRTASENYMNERENVRLAERILERTGIMYREGMASSLELTQANDQLVNTRSNYHAAIYDMLSARNDLEKALGRQEPSGLHFQNNE